MLSASARFPERLLIHKPGLHVGKIKHVNLRVKGFRTKLMLGQCQDQGTAQSPQHTSQAFGLSTRKGSDRLWPVAKEPIILFWLIDCNIRKVSLIELGPSTMSASFMQHLYPHFTYFNPTTPLRQSSEGFCRSWDLDFQTTDHNSSHCTFMSPSNHFFKGIGGSLLRGAWLHPSEEHS